MPRTDERTDWGRKEGRKEREASATKTISPGDPLTHSLTRSLVAATSQLTLSSVNDEPHKKREGSGGVKGIENYFGETFLESNVDSGTPTASDMAPITYISMKQRTSARSKGLKVGYAEGEREGSIARRNWRARKATELPWAGYK